jgi:hypothetical protein
MRSEFLVPSIANTLRRKQMGAFPVPGIRTVIELQSFVIRKNIRNLVLKTLICVNNNSGIRQEARPKMFANSALPHGPVIFIAREKK